MLKKYIDFFKDFGNQKMYAKWLAKHTKPYVAKLLALTLVNSVVASIGIVTSIIGKKIIDSATEGKQNDVLIAIGIYAFITLVSLLLSAFYSIFNTMIIEKYSFDIRKRVYRSILDTCMVDISKYHSEDIMTRLTSDINIVSTGIANLCSSIIVLTVQLFGAFFTLYHFDKWLAICTLMITPITALIGIWLGKKVRYLQEKVQESEANYRAFMQESIANSYIIKAFCNQYVFEKKLNELRKERLYWILQKNKMNVYATFAMRLAYSVVYVIAFAWGAIRLTASMIGFGTMSVFLSLVGQIQTPLINLANQLPQIITVLASAGRIIEIENLEKEKYLDSECIPNKLDIDICNVQFGYSNKENVIDNASLSIGSGEFVAILGESGVGKTTLIKLIMSFLTASSGNISFRDEDNNVDMVNAKVREYMSYVPQGNTLFSGTIEENIRMGKTDATYDELSEAISAACVDSFLYDLEYGLDTKISEKGVGVSEGQAQRIAIARALVRKAPIMIFDEATSSLDEKTERIVLDNIRKLEPRPTCILITHRRSVLDICDRELIIKNGKIESRML